MVVLGFILFFLAGICEAVMDTLQFHYDSSIFKKMKNQPFWNPTISWVNKYKDNDPTEGEKFFLSKSLLVGLTDAWHLFKLLRTFFIFAGIFFLFIPCASKMNCLLYVVGARVFFGISFTLFYNLFEDR